MSVNIVIISRLFDENQMKIDQPNLSKKRPLVDDFEIYGAVLALLSSNSELNGVLSKCNTGSIMQILESARTTWRPVRVGFALHRVPHPTFPLRRSRCLRPPSQ